MPSQNIQWRRNFQLDLIWCQALVVVLGIEQLKQQTKGSWRGKEWLRMCHSKVWDNKKCSSHRRERWTNNTIYCTWRCWHITPKTLKLHIALVPWKELWRETPWNAGFSLSRICKGKMHQSTPLHTDAFDAIDLVDLHGCFRHNWASRSASHHISPSIHLAYLALELRQPTVFFDWTHFYA